MTILLVDDNLEFMELLGPLLQICSEFTVCGHARSGREALQLIETTSPDVMLVDLDMPGMSGLELVRRVRAARSRTRAVGLSGYGECEYARSALRAGADAFVLKDRIVEELPQILRDLDGRSGREAK